MNSFIVEFWSRIFEFLGKISAFELVRAVLPRLSRSYAFVDGWVLAHLFLALGSVFLVTFDEKYESYSFFVVLYGSIRVFEMTIYQVNVLLFDGYRAKRAGQVYALKGHRRIVILLLHNYFEIIFWFACSYIFFADSFSYKWDASYRTVLGAIYSSFIAMSTFGDFNLNPKDFFGAAILLFQSVCGLFMTLLCLARFIALLPVPPSMDELEQDRNPSRSQP